MCGVMPYPCWETHNVRPRKSSIQNGKRSQGPITHTAKHIIPIALDMFFLYHHMIFRFSSMEDRFEQLTYNDYSLDTTSDLRCSASQQSLLCILPSPKTQILSILGDNCKQSSIQYALERPKKKHFVDLPYARCSKLSYLIYRCLQAHNEFS